nr:hypothetical protein [Angustibacter aerolatus]
MRTDTRRGQVLRRLAGDDPEVNQEWNCDKGRWAFTYRTEDRLTHPLVRDAQTGEPAGRLVARGARGRGPRPGGGPRRRWRRRAARRPRDVRGRLRLRQVRPARARHERRRLPRPPALGRGGRLPGPPRGRALGRRRRRHLRRARGCPRGAARRVRARGGVADRLPAAAQGGARAPAAGRVGRAVDDARAREACAARWCPRPPAPRPRCSRPW